MKIIYSIGSLFFVTSALMTWFIVRSWLFAIRTGNQWLSLLLGVCTTIIVSSQAYCLVTIIANRHNPRLQGLFTHNHVEALRTSRKIGVSSRTRRKLCLFSYAKDVGLERKQGKHSAKIVVVARPQQKQAGRGTVVPSSTLPSSLSVMTQQTSSLSVISTGVDDAGDAHIPVGERWKGASPQQACGAYANGNGGGAAAGRHVGCSVLQDGKEAEAIEMERGVGNGGDEGSDDKEGNGRRVIGTSSGDLSVKSCVGGSHGGGGSGCGGNVGDERASARRAAMEGAMITTSQLEDTCSICLGDFENCQQVYLLPCLHMYHRECLDPWIASHSNCPFCKTELNNDDGVVCCGLEYYLATALSDLLLIPCRRAAGRVRGRRRTHSAVVAAGVEETAVGAHDHDVPIRTRQVQVQGQPSAGHVIAHLTFISSNATSSLAANGGGRSGSGSGDDGSEPLPVSRAPVYTV